MLASLARWCLAIRERSAGVGFLVSALSSVAAAAARASWVGESESGFERVEGRKKGAFCGILGGSLGLFRSCRNILVF